jgi:hypothetical protein
VRVICVRSGPTRLWTLDLGLWTRWVPIADPRARPSARAEIRSLHSATKSQFVQDQFYRIAAESDRLAAKGASNSSSRRILRFKRAHKCGLCFLQAGNKADASRFPTRRRTAPAQSLGWHVGQGSCWFFLQDLFFASHGRHAKWPLVQFPMRAPMDGWHVFVRLDRTIHHCLQNRTLVNRR